MRLSSVQRLRIATQVTAGVHYDDNVTFQVNVTMRERWVPHFVGMLQYMEQLGGWGASREVGLYADGDGDFRPEFKFIGIEGIEPAEPIKDSDQDHIGDRVYDAG